MKVRVRADSTKMFTKRLPYFGPYKSDSAHVEVSNFH